MHSLPASLQEVLPIGDTLHMHQLKRSKLYQHAAASTLHMLCFLLLAIHVFHHLVLAQAGTFEKLDDTASR